MMKKLFLEQHNYKYVFCINDNGKWRVTAGDNIIHNYLNQIRSQIELSPIFDLNVDLVIFYCISHGNKLNLQIIKSVH